MYKLRRLIIHLFDKTSISFLINSQKRCHRDTSRSYKNIPLRWKSCKISLPIPYPAMNTMTQLYPIGICLPINPLNTTEPFRFTGSNRLSKSVAVVPGSFEQPRALDHAFFVESPNYKINDPDRRSNSSILATVPRSRAHVTSRCSWLSARTKIGEQCSSPSGYVFLPLIHHNVREGRRPEGS